MTIIYDKDGNSADVDDISRAVHEIDTVHGMVHKGKLFSAVAENQTLANNGYLQMLLQPSRGSHMRFTGFCGGNAHIWLYKNPTWAQASPHIPLTAHNHNDYSAKVSGMTLIQDPAVSANGDEWMARLPIFGGAGGVNAIGTELDFSHERILHPSNEYLIVVQNISGQVQDSHILATWYEPDL